MLLTSEQQRTCGLCASLQHLTDGVIDVVVNAATA
jgi:hypothetical protein